MTCAIKRCDAALALDHIVVCRIVATRSILAISGTEGIDDPRIARGNVLVDMPRRVAAAGRMLCTNTSASLTSRSRASRASGRFKLSVMLRLLRFTFICIAAMPGCRYAPVSRFGSPEGVSILITSAPMIAENLCRDGSQHIDRQIDDANAGERAGRCVHDRLPRSSLSSLRLAAGFDHAQWRVGEHHFAILLEDMIARAHQPVLAACSAERRDSITSHSA